MFKPPRRSPGGGAGDSLPRTAPPRAAPRRRGPRSDVDVRALLLDVAEQQFSERGVAAVSARSLTAAAGLAPATLRYHFGGKDGLVAAVLERRGVTLATRHHELLDRIVVAEDPPTPRSIVEAAIVPYLEILAADPVGGLRWIKVFASVVFSQDPIRAEAIAATPEIAVRFARLLRAALPDVPRPLLGRRVRIAFYGLLSVISNVDLPVYGAELTADGVGPAFVDALVTFTTNGLVAEA
jgi:AcrR family transcriptional regulator